MSVVPLLLAALVAGTAVAARAAGAAARRARVTRRLDPVPSGRQGEHDHTSGGSLPARGQRWRLADPPARVERALVAAGVGVAPPVAWSSWLAAMVAMPGGLVLLGAPAIALVATLAMVTGPPVALASCRTRAAWRFEAALPDMLEAIARALRSGASLLQAVEEAGRSRPGEVGREFLRVAAEARGGSSLVGALDQMARRRPLPAVRLAVAALALGVETGGAQARAVDGVAATLRDRLNVAAEVRALSSQARASALVIGLAPLAFGAFAVAADRRTGEFLFDTGLGVTFLLTGLGLDAAGWLWMRKLARVTA